MCPKPAGENIKVLSSIFHEHTPVVTEVFANGMEPTKKQVEMKL